MTEQRKARTRAEVLALMESIGGIEPCRHCGRCVLCGGPCCQGMADDIKDRSLRERGAHPEQIAERQKAKRDRRVARRAARRNGTKL